MKKLYSYLKKKNLVNKETRLEDVIDEIKSNTKFTFLSNDKIKFIFDKVIASLDEEEERNDTSSESGQIKKKKSKKNKKNKKHKKSASNLDIDYKKLKTENDNKPLMEIEKEDGETSS
jgi:hypothetical protein